MFIWDCGGPNLPMTSLYVATPCLNWAASSGVTFVPELLQPARNAREMAARTNLCMAMAFQEPDETFTTETL